MKFRTRNKHLLSDVSRQGSNLKSVWTFLKGNKKKFKLLNESPLNDYSISSTCHLTSLKRVPDSIAPKRKLFSRFSRAWKKKKTSFVTGLPGVSVPWWWFHSFVVVIVISIKKESLFFLSFYFSKCKSANENCQFAFSQPLPRFLVNFFFPFYDLNVMRNF